MGARLGSAWAQGMPLGWWMVDSGADFHIAGDFIYQYAVVVQRNPNISIRGVDSTTRVDSIVRTVACLPDGDHVLQEVLVCDDFRMALWSTEYMSHFNFWAHFAALGGASYVQTPSGARVVRKNRPYRRPAGCRRPPAADMALSLLHI